MNTSTGEAFGILVVDDEPEICQALSSVLEPLGHRVWHSVDAPCALETLQRERQIDVVFLDIHLGEGEPDGLSLLPQLRTIRPDVDVVMLTASTAVHWAVESMRRGAYDYLTKPWSLDDVDALLLRLKEKRETARLLASVSGQIFLSYGREDLARVRDLDTQLSAAGYKCWLDKRDILGGEGWEAAIEKAIHDSAFFLACLSTRTIGKRGVLQREIKLGLRICETMLESDIYLIPIRFDECAVPGELDRFQWVDYFEPDGWASLTKAIRAGLQRRAR